MKGMFSTLRIKLLDHRNMPQVAGHIKMSLASSDRTLLPLQCTTSQLKLSPTRGRLLNREQEITAWRHGSRGNGRLFAGRSGENMTGGAELRLSN